MRLGIFLACLLLLATACTPKNNQNRYAKSDVGKETFISFGVVVAKREIDITGENTRTGAATGIAGGAVAGSQVGHGSGSLAGAVAGAVVAGLVGDAIEQEIQDSKGIEYTITEEDGKTVTVAQNNIKGDAVINVGDRVMVQKGTKYGAHYVRVLPAGAMPETVKRPKGLKLVD